MKNKDQDKVLEIIAQNARDELFIDIPDINLKHVKTSTLQLFYKAVNVNTLALLKVQQVIAEVLADRAKQAEQKDVGMIGISPEAIHALGKISEELESKLLLDNMSKEK